MQSPKEAIKQIQALTYGAYQTSGQAAALIGESRLETMAEALEQTAAGPHCRPKAGAVPAGRCRESGSERVRAPYPAEHPAAPLSVCSAPVADRHHLPPAGPA